MVEKMITRRERERCATILDGRIADAEASCRDHKDDSPIVRRELEGYLRGLQDAAFAIRNDRSAVQ